MIPTNNRAASRLVVRGEAACGREGTRMMGYGGQQESDRNRRNRLTSEGRSPVTHCAWTRDGTFMESGLSLQRPESFKARKSKTTSGRNIQR
jgi:hypothetical protein